MILWWWRFMWRRSAAATPLLPTLQGSACLLERCLSGPLVLLHRDSIFVLFKESWYCHQGFHLITERHQREMRHSSDSHFVPSGRNQLGLLSSDASFPSLVCYCFYLISFVLHHCVQTMTWSVRKLAQSLRQAVTDKNSTNGKQMIYTAAQTHGGTENNINRIKDQDVLQSRLVYANV